MFNIVFQATMIHFKILGIHYIYAAQAILSPPCSVQLNLHAITDRVMAVGDESNYKKMEVVVRPVCLDYCLSNIYIYIFMLFVYILIRTMIVNFIR